MRRIIRLLMAKSWTCPFCYGTITEDSNGLESGHETWCIG